MLQEMESTAAAAPAAMAMATPAQLSEFMDRYL
jgi:hypothetical protein